MVEVTDKEKVEALLLDILGLAFKNEARKYRCKCHKCKEQKKSYAELDRHHIVYSPRKLVWLCRKCHNRITHLNGCKASEVYRKLNNKDRWEVWYKFIKEAINELEYAKSQQIVTEWFSK